jgi:DNA polymerase elongation subunit (family B)
MAYYTKLPVCIADGPIAQTDSLIFEEFWAANTVYADEKIQLNRQQYDGGYVKEPIRHEVNFPTCIDAKSLYPSSMKTWNLSPDSYVGKCKPEDRQKWLAKGYWVSHKNSVYKNDKDYTYKRIEVKLSNERDKYKAAKADIWENLSKRLEDEAHKRGIHLH